MTFQSGNLLLRQWQPEDAECLFQYAKEPETAALYGLSFRDMEECREAIRAAAADPEKYAMYFKRNEVVVGGIELKIGQDSELTSDSNEAELCSWVCGSYRNIPRDHVQFGEELISNAIWEMLRHAFDDLHLSGLWSSYYDTDTFSQNALNKAGFEFVRKKACNDASSKKHHCRHITCFTGRKWKQLMDVPGSTKFNPIVYVPDGIIITRYNGEWVQTDGYFNGILR